VAIVVKMGVVIALIVIKKIKLYFFVSKKICNFALRFRKVFIFS